MSDGVDRDSAAGGVLNDRFVASDGIDPATGAPVSDKEVTIVL